MEWMGSLSSVTKLAWMDFAWMDFAWVDFTQMDFARTDFAWVDGIGYLPLLLIAAVLACQDFRHREVEGAWLVLLGGGVFVVAGMELGLGGMLRNWAINVAVLVVLLGGLWLWMRFRKQSFRGAFGMGDAAFMLAVAPLFSPRTYVWFLLTSCVVALLWGLAARWRHIPLVGVMGVVLGPFIVAKLWG